ncbi:MAG: hypothetical protein WC376_05475 [Candidatus Nanoarchaeia archaeon]
MNKITYKTAFGIILIIAGVLFQTFKIGDNYYLGFASVGTWLIYVGLVSIAVTVLQSLFKKERKVDERMHFIANKANKITFLATIILSFVAMLWDGISKITIDYSLFMGYFVCIILLVHVISYKIILNKY